MMLESTASSEVFTQGVTYLLPKSSDLEKPKKNYQPITCFPTSEIYKKLTKNYTKSGVTLYEHPPQKKAW